MSRAQSLTFPRFQVKSLAVVDLVYDDGHTVYNNLYHVAIHFYCIADMGSLLRRDRHRCAHLQRVRVLHPHSGVSRGDQPIIDVRSTRAFRVARRRRRMRPQLQGQGPRR